jgi:hypothetical protein
LAYLNANFYFAGPMADGKLGRSEKCEFGRESLRSAACMRRTPYPALPEKVAKTFLQSAGLGLKLPPGAFDASPQINGQT